MVLGHNGSCMEKVVESFTPIFHYALFILYIFLSLYLVQSCLFRIGLMGWIDYGELSSSSLEVLSFSYLYTLSQFDPFLSFLTFPSLSKRAWLLCMVLVMWHQWQIRFTWEGKGGKNIGEKIPAPLSLLFSRVLSLLFSALSFPTLISKGAFCERKGGFIPILFSFVFFSSNFPSGIFPAQFANVGWGFPWDGNRVWEEHICIVYAKKSAKHSC